MPYIGNPPAERFTSFAYQDLTGGSGTSFTLDNAVGNPQEIEVFVNNVRQEPGVAYTVSGTALTMTGSIASTDDFYVVFQGKAIQTATHPSDRALTATDGTFTGDLTVDTNTLHVDAANNRVGIGSASPDKSLDVNIASATMRIRDASGGNDFSVKSVAGPVSLVGSTANTAIGFMTNDTERLRILSGGGLTFNGDTAAANALDDYEFGDYDITLTPSSSWSITPNSSENKASYVKIGNFVQAQGRVTASSVSSPAGDLAINLPFNTTSSQGEQSGSGAPALFVWNSTQTNNGLWCGFFDKGTSAFYIRWGNSSTPGQSASYIQSGTEIRFSVSYITDA